MIELFFDLIGFLIAGWLKIMFWIIVVLGVPFLIIAIALGSLGWLYDFVTGGKDGPNLLSRLRINARSPPASKASIRNVANSAARAPLKPVIHEQETVERVSPVDTVKQRARKAVEPFVRSEPWHSLFSGVIDDLIAGESSRDALSRDKIRKDTINDHASIIADCLILLAKAVPPTPHASPLAAPLVSCLHSPTKTVTELVELIFFRRCGDISEKGHPEYGDLRPRALQVPYSTIFSRVARYDKDANVQYDRNKINPNNVLDDTPFARILDYPVPINYTYEQRFSHTHIIGGNRAGKTTLLKRLIIHDLLADDPPALVIIDSHNDLVDYVAHLDLPRLKDKLVLITPRNTIAPAINIFAFNQARYRQYSELEKEQAATAAIETLDYLFEGLGIDLTGKQGILFEYSARLLLTLPEAIGRNAVLQDLIDLMGDPPPAWFNQAVAGASGAQCSFFERDYKSREFKETKEQVRYRLQGIRQTPTLDRLFSSQENAIDFFDLLNGGAVILIDTSKDFLKQDSSLYGRVFISRVFQAIFERASIPERERKPAFMFVDEAHEYFDTKTKDLLTDCRKFRLGCVFAHHDLEECGVSLRAALATEPAIRMASRVSTDDARTLAGWMRTEADFILQQPRHHFATYIQDVTPNAVTVSVSIDEVNKQPRLSDKAYEEMRRRNSERVSGGRAEQPRQQRQQHPPPPPPREPPRYQAPGIDAPVIDLEEGGDGTYRIHPD